MSAYTVDKTHIDALLTAGLEWSTREGGGSPLRWLARPLTDEEKRHGYAAGQPWGPEAARIWNELRRELTRETAGRVGAVLMAENMRSVNFRCDEDEIEVPYTFERLRGTPDPVVVLSALQTYEYQSCERPDWEISEAHQFCDALRAQAIRLITRGCPGHIRDDHRDVFSRRLEWEAGSR